MSNYTTHYALTTEHGRIGLVTCLRCGAAVILGEDDGPRIHDEWHAVQPESVTPEEAKR